MSGTLKYWWFRLRSALRWYAGTRTRYDVHSPFLWEFLREVYLDNRYYHAFGRIRSVRTFWQRGPGGRCQVEIKELGAPSRTTFRSRRSAAALVASNAIAEREGRLLFRLALWLRADHILELGTNAGISGLYLHLADTRATLHTIEGNPAVAELARRSFRRAGVGQTLHAHVALFSDWLDEHLPELPTQDLVFIDGDHRYAATLDYVRRLLPKLSARSVIVVADIHWSAGMERAWAELRQLPEVTTTVDTYHFGFLFFRPELPGQHLSLIRARYKPWRMGFFG